MNIPTSYPLPNALQARARLDAFEGCYQWNVLSNSLIRIEDLETGVKWLPESEIDSRSRLQEFSKSHNCVSSIYVTPMKYNVGQPNKTTIYANDQDDLTNKLSCQVKVAPIKSLKIHTKDRFLDVDSSEQLQVLAYDSDGNVFDSLEGLSFRWSIIQGTQSLELKELRETTFQLSDLRQQIELSKAHSDQIVIQGKSSGISIVQVQILEPGYTEVPPTQVQIHVSVPFWLMPEYLYIPTYSIFNFILLRQQTQAKENQFYKLDLPHENYEWFAKHENVGTISNSGQFTAGEINGAETQVIVTDLMLKENTRQSYVKVLTPNKLEIIVVEYTPIVQQLHQTKTQYTIKDLEFLQNPSDKTQTETQLIVGRKYLIYIKLYAGSQQLFIPQNAEFAISFQNYYFENKVLLDGKTNSKLTAVPFLQEDSLSQKTLIRAQLVLIENGAFTH